MDNLPILDELGNPILDAVSALILTISLHFVGDPSHIKDKNTELLSNLKCKKLSDFQWYKTQFLTRIMLREDLNQPFWKEKFIAGLPSIIGEKVKTCIREQYVDQICYSIFTYGYSIEGLMQRSSISSRTPKGDGQNWNPAQCFLQYV